MARDLRIMRDQNDRMAFRIQVLQYLEHVCAALSVEGAGRLVGENDIGAVHQSAGDGNALLLAARKLARPVRRAFAHAEAGEQPPRALEPFALCGAGIDGGKFDIFRRGHGREKIVALEHEAERVAPQRSKFIAGQGRNIYARHLIVAAARPVEAAENIHQCGFA